MPLTVLGPAANPGHMQPHEHIFVRRTPAAANYPALEISDEEKSLAELISYREAGGSAIVDAQPVGAGRDARALRRLSEGSGVSIVAVTGFHMPMFYAPDDKILAASEDELFERFLRELTVGTEECAEVVAGAVKAAIGRDVAVGGFRTHLKAAARAAAAAGAPLMLHTEAGAGAVEAIELCGKLGLPPERVILCHADRQASDFSIHERIADAGCYLEYDTIGRFKYHSDEDEVRLILHMLARGHRDRLLLSLDATAARLSSYGGEIGLDYLLRTFLPMLRQSGVPEADILRMTRENPASAFSRSER